jgi:hypothetical protein
VKTRSRARRLLLALLLTAAGAISVAVAYTADLIRFSRNVPGESRPIVIDADEITTWTEGNTRVLLVKGHVLIQQGVVRAQFQDGALFVDMARYQTTQIWNLDIYGEGGSSVQNGAEVTNGATTFLDLHTGGDLKLNAHKNKVTEAARPDDPVYRHGIAQRAAITGVPAPAPPSPPATDAIERTGFTTPAETTGSVTPAVPTQGTLPPPAPPPSALPPPAPPPSAPLLSPVPTAPPAGGAAVPGPGPAVPPASGGLMPGPLGGTPPGVPAPVRQFSIVPRNPSGFHVERQEVDHVPGRPPELATIVTGGFILTVRSVDPRTGTVDFLDVEADRGVIWTRGEARDQADRIQSPEGLTGREMEFYLAGNVEIRSRSGKEERTLRADEVYYDVSRNVALALTADMEWRQPGLPDMIHFTADELQQTSQTTFRGLRGTFFSSKLPSDPGLKVVFSEATLEERKQIRRSIFGRETINIQTDQPVVDTQKLVRADDIFVRLEDVPIFYLPFLQGDANDPLGPLRDISTGYNRIFGFEVNLTWDVFDLLGFSRPANTNWRLQTDYLSSRGPALGTDFDFAGKDPFGMQGRYSGALKLWSIYDTGEDILGGTRDNQPHPTGRDIVQIKGRLDDAPLGFSIQGQVAQFSDQNVQEQYNKLGFDQDPNQETFLYLKQQQSNWAWTLLADERLSDWFTQTNWLPRADGYLIGQSLFDVFSYDVHADLGYAQFRPASAGPSPYSSGPPPILSNAVAVNTGRADLLQEVRLPFYLGPVKVVPYADLDMSYYTNDIYGQDKGRLIGGGGVMASIPFSRLYPDVHSLLWNLDGINHKIVLSGNYYYVSATAPHTQFPELDPLNDNVNDYSLRWMTPFQQAYNPTNGLALMTSPLYNTQLYAIRRLVDNRIDTLDTIEEFQLDLRQRWQTKRGFPGQEHVVDWMTLDMSATVFPAAQRDNFGSTLGFLDYDWNWNIGDRTALTSSGWVDPQTDGPRFFSFGAYLNRTDRTSLFLGYRQIDPLQSKAVTASVSYVFSPKYAMTASTTYDFGTSEALSNSLVFTRMGSDIQVSLGITYNALTNAVGVQFEIVPNLIGNRKVPGIGPGLLGH